MFRLVKFMYIHTAFSFRFLHKHYVGQPVWIHHLLDEPDFDQLVSFLGDGLLLFWGKALLLLYWMVGQVNV